MEQNRPTTAPTLSVSSGRKNSYETEEFSTTSIHILSNHREISSLQPIPILRSTGFGLSGSRSVINKRENTRSAPRLAHINYRDMITNKKAIDTTSIIKSPRLLKSLDTPILKSLDHYPLEEKKDVDDVAKVHNVDTPLVNTNKKTVTIAADPIDDYTMEVKDTTEGNLIYDHDLNHLTQKDRDALRLGRMIISCILTSPEISVPDSISRFFIDAWLSRNGSSTMSADAYSLTLMSNLQKSLTQNDVGIDSNPIGAAKSLKSVCAVACEIFDTMIQLFGKQNPILYDLRESFYPCIYMDYPNANNLAEANIEVPYASPSKNHEGLSYHNRKTWCEDTAIIVQKLFETEELYNKEKKEKQAALQENQALQIKLKQVIHEMEISQGNLIKLEKEHQRIKQRNRDLVSKNEGLEKTCAELTIKSKKDADTISKQQSTISSLRLQIDDLNYRLQQEMTKSDHLQSHLEEKEATLRQFKEENSTLLEKVDSLSKQLAATITREEDYKAKWTLLKQTESNNMKKFQETLQLDSFAAGLLSHNMHALFHHKEPKVFDLLMQWGKDLLKLVKELKHKCSDESLEELVNLKFKEVCERNAEAIKEVQDREDELIRSHKMAMHKLEVDMQKIRIELLDNQMEVKTLEEEKKNMKSSYQELNTRFLSRQKDWEMKFEKTNTTKSTFQDRIGMLFEDTRFEERFRDKTRENVVLKARIAEMLPESCLLKKAGF